MIKYLVLGGGGGGGYSIYGALKYLAKENFWNIDNIKSIYCTSIGAFLSIFISLKYTWEELDDYLIKRPWDKVIALDPTDIINIWNKKGILNEDIIRKILDPLLIAKDLSETITLKQLYEYNNINIHLYTTDITESVPKKVDISYKTHPDLELYKAIAMTSAVPILFSPVIINNNYYIDGGLLNNFPLNDCISEVNNHDEILAIMISSKNTNINTDNQSFLSYILHIIESMRKFSSNDYNQTIISNIVECKLDNNLNLWKEALVSNIAREEIINNGAECAKEFLQTIAITESISTSN
jgi:NTE family protein